MAQASSDELSTVPSTTDTNAVSKESQAASGATDQPQAEAQSEPSNDQVDTSAEAQAPPSDAAAKDDEKSNDLPPKTDVTLTLKGTAEYNAFPFANASEKFYLMASVKASYFKEKDRAAIDLCCVIDESSSMSGARIELVKETVSFVLRNLTKQDRFGIIGYGSDAHTRLPLTKMDDQGKKKADAIVKAIRATGMTALCEGLEYGVNMMRNRNKDDSNQIASVMLFTDGQANVGPTAPAAIQKKIEGRDKPNLAKARHRFQIKLRQVQQRVQSAGAQGQAPPPPPAASKAASSVVQGQGQGQAQAQAQAPGSLPAAASVAGDKDDEKKDESSKKTDEGAIDYALPCTINTFGFGANHNEVLLEALAEWGRGMYTFIENIDSVAETFAECLGGLVSIVGRELKVRVAGLNGVQLLRCVSQGGYQVTETKAKKEFTVAIPDIQSEESRDLVFEVTLPKLEEKRDSWPMAQISCEYQNVPKNKKETLSVIGNINRCQDSDAMGERNDELDAQCNRLLASEAMDVADKMAEKGDLQNARKVLSQAKQQIQESTTFRNQKKGYFKYAQGLVANVDDVTNDLASRSSYRAKGGKKLKMSKKAHAMQRSCNSNNYQSQRAYTNSSKFSMMKKFSKQ